MPLAHDLLQPVPECILEAYARFVASDHDRALDDRRFHEDTPNGPSFDGTAFSAMARFRGGASRRPSMQHSGLVLRLCPRPNTRPANISFIESFRRDGDFLSSCFQFSR